VVQASIRALADLKSFPNQVEIYSDIKSIREYLEIYERVSGKRGLMEFLPLEPAREEYRKDPEKFKHHDLVTILMGEGVYDFTGSPDDGNQLLNPNESVWKLTKAEEYLKTAVEQWNKE